MTVVQSLMMDKKRRQDLCVWEKHNITLKYRGTGRARLKWYINIIYCYNNIIITIVAWLEKRKLYTIIITIIILFISVILHQSDTNNTEAAELLYTQSPRT